MKTATLTMTLLAAMVASAAEIHKAENKDALNLASSWVEGVVPGPSDTIFWHPLTAADELQLGGNMSIFGADFGIYGGASLTVNATQGATLEIGAGGIEMSNTGKSVTLNPAIRLTADQQWANRAGTFNFNNSAASIDLNGHELTLLGINETKASFTGNGALRIQGSPKFSSGASAPNADVTLINGATFHFNQSASENKTVRAKSVTTDGRHNGMNTVYSQGASRNGYDAVEGALTVAYGLPDVNVAPNSAKSQKLEFGSLVLPDTGAGVRFRGLKLGQVKESELANSGASLIKFMTPPTLVEGIIPGSLATSEAHNTWATALATYDEECGVRPLNLETEYDSTLASGEEKGHVRLVSSDTGAHVETTLAAGTTTMVKSLTLDTADHVKGQGGVSLQGEEGAVLKVKSGTIYSRHAMAEVVAGVDYHAIRGVTLDFNGGVARIISRQQKRNNMALRA